MKYLDPKFAKNGKFDFRLVCFEIDISLLTSLLWHIFSLLEDSVTLEAGYFYYASKSAIGDGQFEGASDWTKNIFRSWSHSIYGPPIVRSEVFVKWFFSNNPSM